MLEIRMQKAIMEASDSSADTASPGVLSATPAQAPSPPNETSYLPDTDIRNFAPVARIMKTALPENAKIAKEAKECMQECVSEFISFITSEGTRNTPHHTPRTH